MVVRITHTVNQRGKHLVQLLNEVCDGKLKVLNEKKEALHVLSDHTDHCLDFTNLALCKGSDSAVLFTKKTLVQHLQQVKCQRADIPNPEIPVRIHVQMNSLQELLKIISGLGNIIVDGKTYPPTASPVASPAGQRAQQPSPNVVVNNLPAVNNVGQQQQVQQQQPNMPLPMPMRSAMPPTASRSQQAGKHFYYGICHSFSRYD